MAILTTNNYSCKVEPRCNSGSKERDKLPESSSNSRDETLSRWIMLKRLKSGINKQNAEGVVRRKLSEDVNTEERARATARIELKNDRTTK